MHAFKTSSYRDGDTRMEDRCDEKRVNVLW